MKILFLHQNMPGQYKHLAPAFAKDPENLVVFVTQNKQAELPGIHKVMYEARRKASPHTHRYLSHAETGVLKGQEVWRALHRLKKEEGFVPDVMVCHPGWGDALFLKDVYPDTPQLSFFEFYYHSTGADVGFDPADPIENDDKARVRAKNMHHLVGLVDTDWGITPTFWQHSLHPKEFQSKISVIHDGINTKKACPNPEAEFRVNKDLVFRPGDEVVTYIARNFEPYRGFPTFMQAAEKILKDRPNCHIIACGADEVSYGRRLPEGQTYRKIWREKVELDHNRIHFVGTLQYDRLIQMLQVSAAHIYLTYPFVLSWSTLESMACGCALVSSSTQPVLEAVEDGVTGLLADFFSPEEVAEKVYQILDHKDRMADMRVAARESIVQKYDLDRLLPLHMDLVRDVAEKKFPPPTHDRIMALYDKPSKKAA